MDASEAALFTDADYAPPGMPGRYERHRPEQTLPHVPRPHQIFVEHPLPRWSDPRDLRAPGFHCVLSRAGAFAAGQPDSVPRSFRPPSSSTRADRALGPGRSKKERAARGGRGGDPAPCRHDVGAAIEAGFLDRCDRFEHCGGAVKIIACIENKVTVRKILAHVESATPPPGQLPPARGPPGGSADLFGS